MQHLQRLAPQSEHLHPACTWLGMGLGSGSGLGLGLGLGLGVGLGLGLANLTLATMARTFRRFTLKTTSSLAKRTSNVSSSRCA